MRVNKRAAAQGGFSILALDDDPIMTETLQSYFQRNGYAVDVENNPIEAIETIRNGNYDILMLDYIMSPISGDEVVSRVRAFNRDICIILLTGHRDIVPPVQTIRSLDIQGYCEKGDRFDQLEMLVEASVKSIKQIRTIKKYQQGLTDMVEMMPKISTSRTPEDMNNMICEVMGHLWGTASVFSAFGKDENGKVQYICKNGELSSCVGGNIDIIRKNIALTVPETRLMCSSLKYSSGENMGIIALAVSESADVYEMRRFDIFSKQCAAAIENSLLLDRVKKSNIELVKAIRVMVDAKDEGTRGHCDRVSKFASDIAVAAGLDDKTVEIVRMAGLFHDIGKISVPDSILLSSKKLTEEERNEIQKHTEQGEKILKEIPVLSYLAPIVRSHHERPDGLGYPSGLKENEIPIESQIISVADVYDAMTARRTYSNGKSKEEAIAILEKVKGTQLSARFTDIFIELIKKQDDSINC